MTVSQIITKRILSLCKERGISVNKLASMSGLAHTSIENIIHNASKNPTIITLMKIANAFNMTVAEFLDFDELNVFFCDDNAEED